MAIVRSNKQRSSTKTIVCFANSYKLGAACVAGRQLLQGDGPGPWIRPVSSRPNRAINVQEKTLDGGGRATVLDILEIDIRHPVPVSCHTEDHLIDSSSRWRKVGSLDRKNLHKFCEKPSTLWHNGSHTYNGINDQIPESEAAKLSSSLLLIRPENFKIIVTTKWGGKTQIRADFEYNSKHYNFVVTDPEVLAAYRGRKHRAYAQVTPVAACISIGERLSATDARYKLVASVIRL